MKYFTISNNIGYIFNLRFDIRNIFSKLRLGITFTQLQQLKFMLFKF